MEEDKKKETIFGSTAALAMIFGGFLLGRLMRGSAITRAKSEGYKIGVSDTLTSLFISTGNIYKKD